MSSHTMRSKNMKTKEKNRLPTVLEKLFWSTTAYQVDCF
jgi:hypothetical protein